MQNHAICKQLNGILKGVAGEQLVVYVTDVSCMLHCKAALLCINAAAVVAGSAASCPALTSSS